MSGACPICGSPTVPRYRPFCSKRCADVDLHRWLSGSYAVPAETPMDGLEGDGGLAGGEADLPPGGGRGF